MEKKLDVKIGSKFTLGNNDRDSNDHNTYLYKDGKFAPCPFLSSIRNGKFEAQPCGSFCLHFNVLPSVDADKKPTGKVNVVLTCGSTVRLPISDFEIPKPEPVSALKVE